MSLETVRQIETAKAGQHNVGGASGLLLFVTPSGQRRFAVRFVIAATAGFDAKRVTETIGYYPAVGLADARRRAIEWREAARTGVNPVASLKADVAQERTKAETTFRAVADQYLETHSPNWSNPKHGAQWAMTLIEYAFPSLGGLPIDQIHGAQIMDAMKPHWQRIPETARRTLRRIAVILDYANVAGLREYPSPSSVAIAKALGSQPRKGNFAAVPWADAPATFAKLCERGNLGDMALQFAILCASRSGEVRFATWAEMDLEARLWTIPGARMKAQREHVIPLCDAAVAILEAVKPLRRHDDGLIFPSPRGLPLSDMTLGAAAKAVYAQSTQHGWRSTFRDYLGENCTFDHDLLEACLAHSRGKVHGAYQRGALIEKRRAVMALWADYVTGRNVAALWPDRIATPIVDIATARRGRREVLPAQERLTA